MKLTIIAGILAITCGACSGMNPTSPSETIKPTISESNAIKSNSINEPSKAVWGGWMVWGDN